VVISNNASPEIIWGLGGSEENHQLHHCCWTGRVDEREEEGVLCVFYKAIKVSNYKVKTISPRYEN